MATPTKKTTNVKVLAKQLSVVASQAKSLGINTDREDAMVRQTNRQGSTSFKGSTEEKAYNSSVITANSVKPAAPVVIPQKPIPSNIPDISAINQGLAGGTTGITTDTSGKFTVTAPTAGTDKYGGLTSLFDSYLKESQAIEPVSNEDIYNKQYKASQIEQKQQSVNDYTSQLNTIVANRDANVLKVEGQGRGITDVIIGGQQAQINKEAAIQALPVQAQLAAAQGNLETAQTHLETMFKLKSADATAKFNYKTKLLDSVYSFATGIEQKKLDDLKVQEDRKYTEQQSFIKAQQSALSNALGQGAPASIYNAIKNATDLNGVTLAAGIYNGDVLGRQVQQAQLASANRANQPGVAKRDTQVVGNQLIDLQTGEVISNVNNGGGTLNGKAQNVTQASANGYADRIAQANSLINNVGKNFTGKFAIGGALPNILQTGNRQVFEQAKNNFATAVLRRESGAAISASEFSTLDVTYFPQRGDTKAVLSSKEDLRNTVINNFYREANVPRSVIPGDIVDDGNGNRYKIDPDGETLIPL